MKNIYQRLVDMRPEPGSVCLATLFSKTGSAPQVPGSSALITFRGLEAGTLGGGIMEAEVLKAAGEALRTGKSACFEFELDSDIAHTSAAICGGKAGILIDASPVRDLDVFQVLSSSLSGRRAGVLITLFRSAPGHRVHLTRHWQPKGDTGPLPETLREVDPGMINRCLEEKSPVFVALPHGEKDTEEGYFLEPVFPAPRLIIAGAGHIGRALTSLAALLDFDTLVVDDRPELGTPQNLPEASEVMTGDIGHLMEHLPVDADTYIVIVTRGHAGDADALRACIGSPAAYIGMIGSRRKIALMKKKFLEEAWATPEQWNRIHAPVGSGYRIADCQRNRAEYRCRTGARKKPKTRGTQKEKSLGTRPCRRGVQTHGDTQDAPVLR